MPEVKLRHEDKCTIKCEQHKKNNLCAQKKKKEKKK